MQRQRERAGGRPCILLQRIVLAPDPETHHTISNLAAVVMLGWLRQLGLIGYFIDAIVLGAQCVGFSPFDFIRRPSLWMQVMSEYKVTT